MLDLKYKTVYGWSKKMLNILYLEKQIEDPNTP